MLNAGVGALTDSTDIARVWCTLFDRAERVLKVNCIAASGPTQPALGCAVAERLQDAGVVPENLLIFDRLDYELKAAGYTLNDRGPGLQCRETRGIGCELVLTQATVWFSQELETAPTLNVGATNPDRIDLRELALG